MDIITYVLAKNYTNKVVSESGLKGEPGKSAYEYALDGGFKGTEEEFQQMMASAALEIYTVDAYIDLPTVGNVNYIYRVREDAKLYQWDETNGYYPISGGGSNDDLITPEDIDKICGQNLVNANEVAY